MFLELHKTNIGYKTSLIEICDAALQPGEVCLLIGNNGVGKTTLIKTILHQLPLLSGEILLDGKNLKNYTAKEVAEKIAIVFSKSPIPQNYSVSDLISLGKYIHYPYYFNLSDEDQLEIETLIENLGLLPYKDLWLNQLSDGNLQKAFIGRALAQNTTMIILDEPTTHLDENNKIAILKLLRDLAKKHHKLILFSSHDWRLAKEFADKIWLIADQKMDSGITEDVLLRNEDMLRSTLFPLVEGFVAPMIEAPDVQKEMLYSFLQKNHQKNLSAFKFTWSAPFWEIETASSQEKCNTFEELQTILAKHH